MKDYMAGIIESRDIVNRKIIALEADKSLDENEKHFRLQSFREVSMALTEELK